MRDAVTGRMAKVYVGRMIHSARSWALVLALSGVVWGADERPDILGLRRLEASLQADANAEAADPLVVEEVFMVAPDNPPAELPQLTALRAEMQAWLNEYAKNQVLFRRQDILNLRQTLATMSDDQLARWEADSRTLRDRLSGDSWPVTQQWLRDFLAVQAIYTNDEIAELRGRLATLRPSQLLGVLDHFQNVHLSRLRSRDAVERMRSQQLASIERYRTRSVNTRAASFSARDRFPSNASSEVRSPRSHALARRSEISRRVAFYYLNRVIWGRGFWWLWP